MTDTITKSLISQKKRESKDTHKALFIWDDGLGFRVTPKGRVSWLIKAYLGEGGRRAQQVMQYFGRYPDISIEEARLKAGALRLKLKDGIHLGLEKRQARRKQHTVFQSGKLSDALLRYSQLHRHEKGNYWIDLAGKPDLKDDKGNPTLGGTFKRIVDSLDKDILICSVTKSDINGLIKAKQAEGKKGAARGLFAALSPFFKWAKSEELISSNPMTDLKPPKTVKSRERCLTPDEIKIFWRATGELGYPLGPCYRLLLLTGQRRDEVAGMRWEELENSLWTIPGNRTKNGKPHIVHLSPQALEILAEIPKPDGSKFVFRSSVRKAETKISGFSDAKEDLDKKMGIITDPDADSYDDTKTWRTHDLRRTFVTISGDNSLADPHVIEAAINHLTGAAKAGVAGVYNKAAYLDQRRELFNAWGEYIDGLVNTES
jgi:integrase